MTSEWLTALTALAAVIMGPFVGVYIARHQIRISTVSSNRVEWISQLRGMVSELLAEYRFVDFEPDPRQSHSGQSPKIDEATLQRLFRIETQIRLMLDPEKPEHTELLRTVHNAVTYAGTHRLNNPARINEHVQAIQITATEVFREEWGVVKAGK